LLIVETCQDVLQTKAALSAIFAHFEETRRRVPVIAQVTIEVFGTLAQRHRDRRRLDSARAVPDRRHRHELRHRPAAT
jgi:methionine synthase I (cobalamin-dependent)